MLFISKYRRGPDWKFRELQLSHSYCSTVYHSFFRCTHRVILCQSKICYFTAYQLLKLFSIERDTVGCGFMVIAYFTVPSRLDSHRRCRSEEPVSCRNSNRMPPGCEFLWSLLHVSLGALSCRIANTIKQRV